MNLPFRAAIFDLDGVLTNTAHLHERAWHEVTGCTHEEYLNCFDGKKRMTGLRAYMASRGDQANEPYLEHLCQRKDVVYRRLLGTEGIKVYDDAFELLRVLDCPIGIASSSRNARSVAQAGGVVAQSIVDGDGPSKPESYLMAAQELGVPFSECAVFEDSPEAALSAMKSGAKYVVFCRKDRE